MYALIHIHPSLAGSLIRMFSMPVLAYRLKCLSSLIHQYSEEAQLEESSGSSSTTTTTNVEPAAAVIVLAVAVPPLLAYQQQH